MSLTFPTWLTYGDRWRIDEIHPFHSNCTKNQIRIRTKRIDDLIRIKINSIKSHRSTSMVGMNNLNSSHIILLFWRTCFTKWASTSIRVRRRTTLRQSVETSTCTIHAFLARPWEGVFNSQRLNLRTLFRMEAIGSPKDNRTIES